MEKERWILGRGGPFQMEDKAIKKMLIVIQKAITKGNVAELKQVQDEMNKGLEFLSLSTHKFVAEYNSKVPINKFAKSTKIISKSVSDLLNERNVIDLRKGNPNETSNSMTPAMQRTYEFFHLQLGQIKAAIIREESTK